MTDPSPWVLLQRDDCHLCDLALGVLADARFPDFDTVFLEDNPELEIQWGDKIPVLLHVSSRHYLAWPFTENALQDFRQGVESAPVSVRL